jgi:hypothetical protein
MITGGSGSSTEGCAQPTASQEREPERQAPSFRIPAMAAAEIGVFLLFFLLAVVLQRAAGAYSSELAHYPDESSHYVTGLMVRDYLASGFSGHPVGFAERFYARFPKVAFGVWPPLFHLIMGVWLLPTPDGRTSVLLLMALIMTSAAYILYRAVRDVAGRTSGLLIGLLLMLLPVSQVMTDTVMADSLVMLTVLATSAAMARWLKTGAGRDAIGVGIFAGMAMMSKGNGTSVVLAVPLAIVVARRFDLLRKPATYVAGAFAGGLGFAWQLQSLNLYRQMSSFHAITLAGLRSAFEYYFRFIFHAVGFVLCALIILGLVACAGSIKRRDGAWNLWVSMGVTAFSVIAFHILVPHPVDGRYMLAGIAPLLVFLVPAAWKIRAALPLLNPIPTSRLVPLLLSCVLAIFLAFFFYVPKLPRFGFREAAAWLQSHRLPGQRYLIASDANGEGAFISEVASRTDRRVPDLRIMRVSKLLFVSDWNGHHYKLVYDTAGQALDDIEKLGISYIVVDGTRNLVHEPHWEQVRRMLDEYSGRLQLVHQFPTGVNGPVRSLAIYKVLNFANPPVKRFGFQTIYTRGGDIEE